MKKLRSLRWFEKDDLRSFGHRSRVNQMGFAPDEYIGKPIIAIVNTWNDFNTCHTHFKERVEEIKRGVLQAGGFPMELPVMSVGEQLIKPTSMMFRNFLAMEVEEMLRAFPVDGAVLMGGCDKTTPAILMGAISFNLPIIYMPAGAMLRGNFDGEILGSGTDVWKYWDKRQAGCFGDCEWRKLEMGIARSAGTCMTMGTAATMMVMAEALGLALPGSSSIPAVDSNHSRMARQCGIEIVKLVKEDKKPSDFLNRKCFENAIITLHAIGGSTNAIIHLLALAKRAKIDLTLDDFESLGENIPLLLNLKPSGEYVMEDFYYAGGILALQNALKSKLHNIINVNGKKLYDNISGAQIFNPKVIHTLENPLNKEKSLVVLKGNLCPNGAILKQSACEKRLLKHKGKALVYEDIEDLKANIDEDNLEVNEDTVLVLKNAGPVGAPGMPEWGQLPIPKKLLKQGVKDLIRISDARMSGTSYGACILHISPESFIGGNLALVKTGDIIHLDVEKRLLELCLSEEELNKRHLEYKTPKREYSSGYLKLYVEHVMQADQGCDFDFLSEGDRKNTEPRIF